MRIFDFPLEKEAGEAVLEGCRARNESKPKTYRRQVAPWFLAPSVVARSELLRTSFAPGRPRCERAPKQLRRKEQGSIGQLRGNQKIIHYICAK